LQKYFCNFEALAYRLKVYERSAFFEIVEENSSLLGIDRNQHKIDAANSMYNNEKTMFLCADINKDLFSTLTEYLNAHNKDGFDIIHISSVLLHIEDPDVLLNNLKNFLSENGRLFIQDEDDGMNIVFPFEKSFEDCFYVWDHSIESGDRFMGRKIPYYLSESNYSDIKVYSTAITSADFNGKKKDCLWDLYFNCDLWVADDESYYDNAEGYKRYRAYKENYAELKKAYMNGQYFIMLGILFISAKK